MRLSVWSNWLGFLLLASSLLFLGNALFPSAAVAELFVYEGFDYEAGIGMLTGNDGGIGWDGEWDFRDDRPEVDIAEGTLEYTDSKGNQLLTSGNHTIYEIDGSASNLSPEGRRLIDISAAPANLVEDGRLGKDNTSIWLSFIFQAEVTEDRWGGISLFDENFDGGSEGGNRLDIGQKRSQVFSMGFPGSPDPTHVESDLSLEEQSLIVVRIDFEELTEPDPIEPVGDDKIYMWLNPDLGTTPDDSDAFFLPFRQNSSAADQDPTFMFDRIRITKGREGFAVLDELRIGETYADVTPIAGGGLLGDFNANGELDLPDVNMLSVEINVGTNDDAFDLNADAFVDDADLTVWVKELKKTWFGDADLDGLFSTGDLVSVLGIGKFARDEDAGWEEGDWTGDLRFNSADVVKALADGGFDAGPVVATAAVPEPSSVVILTILSLGLMLYRRS